MMSTRDANSRFTITWILLALVAAAIIAVGIVVAVYHTRYVQTISGVPPGGGEVTLIAGLGEELTPDTVDHSIEINNTGIVTINSFGPNVFGDFVIDVVTPGLGIISSDANILLSNEGVTEIEAGPGIAVSGGTGVVMINNTGVLSNIPGAGIGVDMSTGDVTITNTGVRELTVVGAGLSANDTTGEIALSNTGVLSANSFTGDVTIASTDGLSTDSAGNVITLADILTTQTALNNADSLGPVVDYTVAIGFIAPVPIATWRTGVVPGFPLPFLPGSADDGQGNLAGTAWAVPTLGTYTLNVDCDVVVDVLPVNENIAATVALSLAATSEDPLAAGYIPFGGYSSLNLAGGATTNAAPPLPYRTSMTANFQAGCIGCLVQVGNALNVHARVDGGTGAELSDFMCRVRVTRIK